MDGSFIFNPQCEILTNVACESIHIFFKVILYSRRKRRTKKRKEKTAISSFLIDTITILPLSSRQSYHNVHNNRTFANSVCFLKIKQVMSNKPDQNNEERYTPDTKQNTAKIDINAWRKRHSLVNIDSPLMLQRRLSQCKWMWVLDNSITN
jgi:hypothetical protein